MRPRKSKFNWKNQNTRYSGTSTSGGYTQHALAKYQVLEVVVYAEEDAAAAGIASSMKVVTGHRAVLTTVVEGEGV